MKKNELIAAMAERGEYTKKDAERALNLVLDTLTALLAQGEKISITGFGNFEVREHPAKPYTNPRTGEKGVTAAYKAVAFKAGKSLKDAVNPEQA